MFWSTSYVEFEGKEGCATIFFLIRYVEFREQGCARIYQSSRYAEFEQSWGAPLWVECFGHYLFTKSFSSLNLFIIYLLHQHLFIQKQSGSSRLFHQKSGSLKTVFRAISIYPKLNLQLADTGGFVAPAIIKWRYLIVTNLFKSVCLDHSFSFPVCAFEGFTSICTCSYLVLLLYTVDLPRLTRIPQNSEKFGFTWNSGCPSSTCKESRSTHHDQGCVLVRENLGSLKR